MAENSQISMGRCANLCVPGFLNRQTRSFRPFALEIGTIEEPIEEPIEELIGTEGVGCAERVDTVLSFFGSRLDPSGEA